MKNCSPENLGNPFATTSWIGTASWTRQPERLVSVGERDAPFLFPALELLELSAPETLDCASFGFEVSQAMANFVPWRKSGIVLVTLAGVQDVLVAAVDLAGRQDLRPLAVAGSEQRVMAVVRRGSGTNARDTGVCPLRPVVGLQRALAEASSARRLAGREFQDAIRDLRRVLRGPALFPMVGVPHRHLESVTLNVCQPA